VEPDPVTAPTLPVFVYGTLRPGRVNWPVAEPLCIRHEPALLPGFALYGLEWPCAVGARAHTEPTVIAEGVRGDLLWFDPPAAPRALDTLDRFEDVVPGDPAASLYLRERHPVLVGDRSLDAWVYVPGALLLAQVTEERRVPGDDW
jgi:gamma-glutamylcyclotransferase (GGCT)/AIG2-like uncharacterized protein YtfP